MVHILFSWNSKKGQLVDQLVLCNMWNSVACIQVASSSYTHNNIMCMCKMNSGGVRDFFQRRQQPRDDTR